MAPEVALFKATRLALVKVLENIKIREAQCEHDQKITTFKVPSRQDQIRLLRESTQKGEEFDVLIIGGGSTGAGAALDAITRGLKTACVEKEDFASGTSSRSTKLIWGGSRYLVQALVALFSTNIIFDPVRTVKKFSADFKMVMNCHRERKFLLQTQPHLTWWVPIAVPLKRWFIWPPPFGYYPAAVGPLGLFPLFFKFYDSLAGFSSPPSHVMTPSRARRKFPQLNNDEIKYCSVFYEGMHDDARTNLAIALTAATHGAVMTNYAEVVDLISEGVDHSGRVVGAVVRDRITGELITVRAKSVLICGGPFTDSLRKMEAGDGRTFASAVTGSSGIHIVLPSYFAPPSFGFVDMSTSDGRFMFFLPWESHIVVGTTDHKCKADNYRPEPSENEIQWLLNELSKYLSPDLKVQRKHVLSAWSGIRPLAIDPHNLGGADGSTAAASRDHIVSHNPESGVVFVAGGKWTTYREMAEDGIDKLVKVSQLYRRDGSKVPASTTLTVPLVGKDGYSETLNVQLLQELGDVISPSTAAHLVRAYGGRVRDVLRMTPPTCTGTNKNHTEFNSNGNGNTMLTPLVKGYPYIEAEVIYAVRNEYALRIEDIIARRTRLAFLNREAALAAIPRVAQLMKAELGWTDAHMAQEMRDCVHFLQSFGGPKPLRNELGTIEGGMVRMATVADIEQVFSQLSPSHSTRNQSSPTTADIVISASDLELAAELLGYSLSIEEIKDCVLYCTGTPPVVEKSNDTSTGLVVLKYTDKISMQKFASWWNSERCNPNLKSWKATHTTPINRIEGSGTTFG